MSDPVADKRKRFVRKFYKTKYGNFPTKPEEDMEMREWFRFIDKIPAHKMQALFDRVTDRRGKARYRPMLEDFERAWMHITGAGRQTAMRAECGLCQSTGYMSVIGHKAAGEWVLGYDAPDATIVHVPCLCTQGDQYAPPDSREAREKAKEWMLAAQSDLREHNEGLERPLGYISYLDKIVTEKKYELYNTVERRKLLKGIMAGSLGRKLKL